MARRGDGVLFVYHRPTLSWEFGEAANVEENIAAFERHSRYRVWSVNTDLVWSTTAGRGYEAPLEGLDFGAIVLHYSLFGAGLEPYKLGDRLREHLLASPAYKVAFFQDEHQWCKKRFRFIDEYGIDCVFTMLEQPWADRVYLERTNATRAVPHLPGYVGPELPEAGRRFAKPDEKRRIDISYRGRSIAARMGRGALEKGEIGELFRERDAGGLVTDIETTEGERIYGRDWFRFLADSKGTLGVESGVSCFDIEDEVLEEYLRLSGDGHEPPIEELEQGALGRWDWKIPYRTIGPRHFEAAALSVCQILYEGHYSGAMEPGRHYIELSKDFSNFDEVLERFRDRDLRRELTANAKRDLIDSGAYGYERLISSFDAVLADAGVEPSSSPEALARIDKALRRPLLERIRRPYAMRMGYLGQHHYGIWRLLQYPLFPLRAARGLFLRLAGRR